MLSVPIMRARWAAVGAALAVAVGAGGVGLSQATSPAGASAYVPIVPCRLADTRADSNVGPRSQPLGAEEAVTYEGWGDVAGDCDLPTGTTGLQLNVTAVGASALTNLRFYPEGAATPTASNLNPAPGQPPTPNAVTVTLSAATGKFHVFNRFGAVDIVVDVLGYYTDHHHDDRYYTKLEIDDSYYTKAEIDMLTEPDPFLPYHPHVLDFSTPDTALDPERWTLDDGWERAAGAASCLIAPIVDPPAELRINTLRLAYRAFNDAEVDVAIISYRNTGGLGGPPTQIVSFVNDAHALPGNLVSQNAIIQHDRNEVPGSVDAGPIPGPGYDTILQICSASTLAVLSVTLEYDPDIGVI